ncbi:MFS transporter [Pseudarthrobacter sp. So.54]
MKQAFQDAPGENHAALPLRRNRDFLLASGSRFIATAGMGAVIISVMLYLQRVAATGQTSIAGPWLVAAYLFCSALPLVLLAPWAYRLADTRDSRTLAAGSSVLSAAAVAGMGIGLQDSENHLLVLFAMTFLLGAAQAVAGPTWQALLPRIVGEEGTPRALGTMQATIMIAGMVGPAAGGLLSGWGGYALVFTLASSCYVAMAAGALLIRTRRGSAADRAGKEKPALWDGLRLIRRDGLVWALVLGALFFIMVGEATNVLEVFLARDELGATEMQYGLVAASFGLGMASGAALAARIRTPAARLRILLLSMGLTSAFLGIIAMVPSMELLFVVYTAMGAACGLLNACFGAIVILRIPEDSRGQAMAILGGLTRAVSIGAVALGGLLGALLPLRASFLAVGACGVLAALAVTAYVLPRYGSEGAAGPTPEPRQLAASGGQQETVAHQIPHLGEEPAPEGRGVPVLAPAQQRLEGTDDLPDGQVAVAR